MLYLLSVSKYLPEEELSGLVEEHMQSDDLSADWTLRHGRSTMVFVALKVWQLTNHLQLLYWE